MENTYFVPKYLVGPVSVVELYNKYLNKHMWLFGDVHVKEKTCIEEPSKKILLYSLINNELLYNNKKLIDIYIESSFMKDFSDIKPGKISFLSDLIKVFDTCLIKDKTGCGYKNARFHYVDIRVIDSLSIIFFDAITLIVLFMKDKLYFKAKKYFSNLLKTYNNDLNLFMEYINNFNFISYLERTKILKQIKNIKDLNIQGKFLDYITELVKDAPTPKILKEVVKQLIEDFSKSGKFANNQYDDNKDDMPDYDIKFYKIQSKYFLMNSELLDIYMLARIFRSYPQSKNDLEHSKDAENIIIYAGDAHIQNCVNILTNKFGFQIKKSLYSDDEDQFQCIDISSIKFPLFK